jgi:hypothetical protein
MMDWFRKYKIGFFVEVGREKWGVYLVKIAIGFGVGPDTCLRGHAEAPEALERRQAFKPPLGSLRPATSN